MLISRLRLGLWTGGALGALALAPSEGLAQAVYPHPWRPIRLLVGLAAGGSLDGQACSIAQGLSELAGTQVIVDNKLGARMMLSATELMRSAPDGHTPSSVPNDPFKDFTPINMVTRGPLVGMAQELVTKVNALLTQALLSPQVKEFVARGAYEVSPSMPAELAADIRSAYDKWGAMIKQIGFVKQ